MTTATDNALAGCVLVVGAFRSGTTFLSHLVGVNDEVASFSQPLPLFFVELKRRYLQESGRENAHSRYYPLNDQQFGNHYPVPELVEWLGQQRISRDQARGILESMRDYSGQMVRLDDIGPFLAEIDGSDPARFVATYLRRLAGSGQPRWLSLKETTGIEEFVPYWLSRGGHVIHVVRDPVAVARSLSSGNHGEHTGARRPLLWVARNWRKSALYALAHRDHPRALLVDFAELTGEPMAVVRQVRRFLGLPDLDDRQKRSVETALAGWRGNSSRREAATPEQERLPEDVDRFVAAWCAWEARQLGLPNALSAAEIAAQIDAPLEFEFADRPQLADQHYVGERRREEIVRHAALNGTGRVDPSFVIFETLS